MRKNEGRREPAYSEAAFHALRVWARMRGTMPARMNAHERQCYLASVAALAERSEAERGVILDVFSQRGRYVSTSLAMARTAEYLGLQQEHVLSVVQAVSKDVAREMDLI